MPEQAQPITPVERRVRASGLDIVLDLGPQRLSLEVPVASEDGEASFHITPDVVPLPALPAHEGFVSAAALAQKAKYVDDRLMAATKLMLMAGAGRTPGRRYLLAQWAARLFAESKSPRGDAVEILLAACKLGQIQTPPRARALDAAVDKRIAEFLSIPRLSLPLGFHGDTAELADAFRQNRMLATHLTNARAITAVAGALHGDRALRAAYEAQLHVRSRVTNPPKRPDLHSYLSALDDRRAAPRHGCALFPPLCSPEAPVIRDLVEMEELPSVETDVLGIMIQRLQEGRLNLTPDDSSGFYQYQWWAAAPLAAPDRTPESARLRWEPEYRKYLELMFRAVVAFARETHVEDLEEQEEAEEDEEEELEVHITPALTVEPLPTHYVRRAAGYRFLRKVLTAAFGDALLEAPRGVPGWPRDRSVREELDSIADLFVGAAVTAWRELGRAPQRIARAGERAAIFDAWRTAKSSDPDLGKDARMMVPVSVTPGGVARVWMFLGWRGFPLQVGFASRPSPRIVGAPPKQRIKWVYGSRTVRLHSPVIVEGYVRRLLDRGELRSVCDRARSVGAILEAVGFQRKLPT